jgi:hypothetical protein
VPLSLQGSLIVFSTILAQAFAVGIRTMVVVAVQGAPPQLIELKRENDIDPGRGSRSVTKRAGCRQPAFKFFRHVSEQLSLHIIIVLEPCAARRSVRSGRRALTSHDQSLSSSNDRSQVLLRCHSPAASCLHCHRRSSRRAVMRGPLPILFFCRLFQAESVTMLLRSLSSIDDNKNLGAYHRLFLYRPP